MIEGKRWSREELLIRKNESRMPLFFYDAAPGREVYIFHATRKIYRHLLDKDAGVTGSDIGYRKLAIAVIMRAVLDYLNPNVRPKYRRDAATFLLFDTSEESQVWFHILGLDKSMVRRYLQEIEREIGKE